MTLHIIRILQVYADAIIFLCYMGLAVWCWSFLKDVPRKKAVTLGLLFGSFIFFCGLTHLIDTVAEFRDECQVSWLLAGIVKAITASVSLGALCAAWVLFAPAKNLLRTARPILIDSAWASERFRSLVQTKGSLEKMNESLSNGTKHAARL